jgi:hypothetical protein
MAKVMCPGCLRLLNLPPYVLAARIKCPQCSHFFQTDQFFPSLREVTSAQPPAPEPAPRPPGAATPVLLAPHHCQHCRVALPSPAGRTEATATCPACDNKTSVYAVLFRCHGCGRLLESPSDQVGREDSCPVCFRRLTVPRDVLRRQLPDPPDESWFGIYCPHCSGRLVANRKDVGSWSTCPHCLVPLVVPNWGHYVRRNEPGRTPDPLVSLHAIPEVRCPQCDFQVPVGSETCPYCGSTGEGPIRFRDLWKDLG